MVLVGREEIDRSLYLRQVDRDAALRRLAGNLDVVFEISIASVPAVHRTRQTDAVGIPIQQVERVGRCALEIVIDDVAPDQIIGAQRAKGKSQFLAGKNTALPDRSLA